MASSLRRLLFRGKDLFARKGIHSSASRGKPVATSGKGPRQQSLAANTSNGTLQVALQNKTQSGNVWAYITGLALNDENRPIFIQADGKTVYRPDSPANVLSKVEADCAIPLGNPGNTVNVTIPKMAGGRIWFAIDDKLTFYINPGPNIVNPSVTNPTDPNINVNWTFAEFTFNDAQLFANISYVDFVSIPVAMSIATRAGATLSVPGMRPDGFQTITAEMQAQAKRDGKPWDQLIHSYNGRPLRVLNPTNLLSTNGNVWSNYWDDYVQRVWARFRNEDMIINTQADAGNLRGRVVGNELQLGVAGSFTPPSSADIFSCNTGPFATGSNQARNAAIPRLAAAFNRSQFLNTSDSQFPNGGNPNMYYQDPVTNHYSRIVHQVQKDGRGYAFPYDDVVPDGGQDVAGTVFAGDPQVWTVSVGGN
jgi:hypothetical protein